MLLEEPRVYHVDSGTTRTITNIANIEYADEFGETIECVVVFKEFPAEPMGFLADKFDPMAHGREIYRDLVAGVFGEIAPYNPDAGSTD